jgi:hypothetical protein
VWIGAKDFVDASLEWYDDVENLDRWIVADGPDAWRRIASVEQRLDSPARDYSLTREAVSNILIEGQRISFSTTAVGVPHMVKVSYFPNWKASGANGPYRAAPSLMVVIPTSEEVVLTFEQTWVEYLGKVLSLATLLVLGLWGYRSRRERPRSDSGWDAIEDVGT